MEKCDAGFSVKFSTIWLAFSKSNYSGRFCWVLSVPRAQGAFVGGKFRFDTEEAMAAETRLTELDLHSAPAVLRSFHQLETDVRRALNAADGLDIGSLVVRRLPNGICLEGVIRVSSDDFDVCSAVREIEGVGEVVNNLVVCWNCPQPASGVRDEMFM